MHDASLPPLGKCRRRRILKFLIFSDFQFPIFSIVSISESLKYQVLMIRGLNLGGLNPSNSRFLNLSHSQSRGPHVSFLNVSISHFPKVSSSQSLKSRFFRLSNFSGLRLSSSQGSQSLSVSQALRPPSSQIFSLSGSQAPQLSQALRLSKFLRLSSFLKLSSSEAPSSQALSLSGSPNFSSFQALKFSQAL